MSVLLLMMPILFSFSVELLGQQVRLKELVNIQGVRENQLVGYGLVVGLRGTGDSPAFYSTNQAITNLMREYGMPTERQNVVGNSVASVLITAMLPAFAKVGNTFDISVSTLGDAVSLESGVLLPTTLVGPDKKTYAVASGRVISSALAQGRASYGRVVNGAVVEREIEQRLPDGEFLTINLNRSDFTNAQRIAKAINKEFLGDIADPIDSSGLRVRFPFGYGDKKVKFISELENIEIKVDMPAKVVVSQSTGTVVFGGNVKISPASISHHELVLVVGEQDKSTIKRTVTVKDASVSALIETLNLIGAGPKDLMAILQALKKAGALQADLEFI